MWCAKLLLSSDRVRILLSTCGVQVGSSLVVVCGSSLVVVGDSSGVASGALVFLLRWGLHSSGGGWPSLVAVCWVVSVYLQCVGSYTTCGMGILSSWCGVSTLNYVGWAPL